MLSPGNRDHVSSVSDCGMSPKITRTLGHEHNTRTGTASCVSPLSVILAFGQE